MSSSGVVVKLGFSNEVINLAERYNIKYTDIKLEGPVPNNTYTQFSGSNGRRLVNSNMDAFGIMFNFRVYTSGLDDSVLAEIELRRLFFKESEFYFFYSKEPGKRFKVSVSAFDIERSASFILKVSAELSVDSGHSESIASTLSNFSLDESWQFSQGLVSEDYEYTHQTSRFTIFNAGDFTIDPRENYLKIKIEGMSDGNLTVFNATTGERFIYRGSLNSVSGETLTLDGVYPLKNGIHCGIDTNHGLISLVPGENKIEISNVSRIKTAWDFRFLYK